MTEAKLNRVIKNLSNKKMSPEMKAMIARMNITKKRVEASQKSCNSTNTITISSGI